LGWPRGCGDPELTSGQQTEGPVLCQGKNQRRNQRGRGWKRQRQRHMGRAQVKTDVFENCVNEMIVSCRAERVVGVVGGLYSAWNRCRTMLGIQNSRIDGESNRLIREVMETTRISSVNENTVGVANIVEKLVRIIAVNGDNSNMDWIGGWRRLVENGQQRHKGKAKNGLPKK